ncbi:MAG: hypothetical protein IIW10_00120 [Spirochaetaceae bacterium]|nr:hypothetical protein [Spirochaetaceae bacterium]
MDLSTLYGNEVPENVAKEAKRSFEMLAKYFKFDPNDFPRLSAFDMGDGFNDFGIKTVLSSDFTDTAQIAAHSLRSKNSVMIGTIRMGFGHCRIAIALCSAAKALGVTPYWMDLLSFPEYAGTRYIKQIEKMYNLGSRISQRWKFFDKHIWSYFTSDAGMQLTFTVKQRSMWQIIAPLFADVPKDIPFLSTHPWVGHGAVAANIENVVTIVPDNFPVAFHLVPGSTHAIQSPSAYMGYRTFMSMGQKMLIQECLPQDAIFECGHYVDHEIVENVEIDCENRLRRMRENKPRRILLTMGGAGAQVKHFSSIVEFLKGHIEDKKCTLFINMGDHNARWENLKANFDEMGVPYCLHSDWDESRSFIANCHGEDAYGIHVFLHNYFYAAVYSTNLLMRICDVMITKPSELSFYPVPKIFIQRVGRHEAWGAIRGSEIGDGTIETSSPTNLRRTLKIIVEESDLLEIYCKHIIQNKKNGIYNGAYNAIKRAIS